MTCELKSSAAFHTLLYFQLHIRASSCAIILKFVSMKEVDVFRELQERYFGSNGKFEAARIKVLEVLNSLNGTKIISAYDIQATEFEGRLKKVSCFTDDLKG